jgi:GTP-binding protein
MFLDEAEVEFSSGRGGSGSASFHREKHVPRGGPNGSDGGKGGDIVLIADRGRRTLYDFKLHSRFQAKPGDDAAGNKRGKDAEDIEIHVPIGTIVYDTETGDLLTDLNVDGMRYMLCKGGKGGFGNLHYTSSVRQAPTFAMRGAPEETVRARLELKLLADVGLIGLPNAGKSTLISRISAAKPKIADYPFTTITPNLGVVSFHDTSFTVADMPGLVEGASEGKGLGHQFLKHVERTRLMIHLIECSPLDETDPVENYDLIESELAAYSPELAVRPRLIAISKADLGSPEDLRILADRLKDKGHPVFTISSATDYGIEDLLTQTVRMLEEQEKAPPVPILVPAMRQAEDMNWDVERTDGSYHVHGKRVERLVAMTDLANDEALRYLHRRLERIGVINKLRDLGAGEGDTVRIGDLEFAFSDR